MSIGVLTFTPFAYGAAVNVSIFLAFATGRYPSFDSTAVLMLAQALVVLLVVGLLASYLWFLFEAERIASDKKPLWTVVLSLGNVVSMPIFWYLHTCKPACDGS